MASWVQPGDNHAMPGVATEILIILLLLLLNGVFAMVEIAVVSSRKSRLRQWAEAGDKRSQAALDLAESPNRFLSTVQIGITMVGVLAGAFGGATLAKSLAAAISAVAWLARWADALGVAVVVGAITFCSLVIGELVPKRIGLGSPEMISRFAARPMGWLSWLAHPLVRLLGISTDAVLRLLRIRPAPEAAVSEEEVRMLVREGELSGALLPQESEMVEAVLGLDRLRVRDLMTPRGDMVWLDVEMTDDEVLDVVLQSRHTHFPCHEDRRDNLLGVVSVKDLFTRHRMGGPLDLRARCEPPLLVPPSQPAIRLLETFRGANTHFALVADEYGGIAGLITLHDLMEAIIGDFGSAAGDTPNAVQREDGSWLVDAMIRIDELEELFPGLPVEPPEDREYSTLSGFILNSLGHLPVTGEQFERGGFRIEVVDLDRNRVDKVIIHPPIFSEE